MLRILRELESNMFAMMLALFVFIFVLLVTAAVLDAVLHVVDWGAVLGLGGMGTGNSINAHINQMLSNRSPNYQPLIASQPVETLPPPP